MNCLHHSTQQAAAVIGALLFARVMLMICGEREREGEGAA